MAAKKLSALFDGKNVIFIAAVALTLFGFYYFRQSQQTAQPHQLADADQYVETSSGSLVASEANPIKKVSPLEKVIAEIDSGYYGSPRYRASQSFQVDSAIDTNKPMDPRVAATWNSVSSANYVRALQDSKKQAKEFFKFIKPDNFNSRTALTNHIKGIEFILSKPDQSLSPSEAMAYVDHLHLLVAEGLSNDGIDRYKRRAWDRMAAKVRDVGAKVVEESQKAEIEADKGNKIVVTHVSVIPGTATVSVNGLVREMEVDKVVVYWNGALYATAQVRATANKLTSFHFEAQDGRGMFNIQALDKNGFAVSREYKFFEQG